MTSVKFEDALRQEMSRTGHTQAELCILLGVDASTVSNWLRGRNEPRYSMLQRIVRVYPGFLVYLRPGDGRTARRAARVKIATAAS